MTPEPSTPEMKACPFCDPPTPGTEWYSGCLPELMLHNSNRFRGSCCWVECNNCGAVGPLETGTSVQHQAQAIAAWNHRTPAQAPALPHVKRPERPEWLKDLSITRLMSLHGLKAAEAYRYIKDLDAYATGLEQAPALVEGGLTRQELQELLDMAENGNHFCDHATFKKLVLMALTTHQYWRDK